MIKLKKLLAGVLGAAMMLATGVTAMATDDQTVDTTKTGSLTLYKYYYENNIPSDLENGTGETEEITDANAKALEGAEFSIWRFADIDGNILMGTNAGTFTVDGNTATDVANAKDIVGNATVTQRGTTDADGKVAFTDLQLGYYLVIETKSPENVTTTSEFVVSIPMTNKDTVEGTESNEGTKWIYDVVVYPKNVKVNAGITLKKNGNGTALDGAKFVLQYYDGSAWKYVTKDGDKYVYTGTTYDAATTPFTVSSTGLTFSGLKAGQYRFIEVYAPSGYIVDGTKKYGFTISDSGVVSAADDTTAYFSQDASNTTVGTITVNNEKPDLDKTVKDRVDTDESTMWDHDADYSVGDTIQYKVVVSVPSNITSLKYFAVTDAPTNLIDQKDTIKVYSEEVSDSNLITSTDVYEVAASGDGFKVTFNTANMADYAGKEIIITYDAILQASADMTTAGNPNTATLEYSNKIVPDTEESDNPNKPSEKDGHDSISDEAVVYTFKLDITKYKDSVASGNELSGVEFKLYKYEGTETNPTETQIETNGTAVNVTGSAGIYQISTTATDNTVVTGSDGKIVVTGLENGKYYLIETKTAEGYNLLTAPVALELKVGYTYGWSEHTNTSWTETTDADGVVTKTITKHETERSEFKFTDTDDTTNTTGVVTQTIVNKKGFTLPATGGMGSIIFIVGGIAIALAGLLIILASRKRSTAE